MNKKSSLKKKSSLLPFLALPAAGALAGGAYYWQQNNGEDAGLSKQEKAKRLLRCLILGGATGLGAATAYTGGKMVYNNLIKDSSYKKKVTKSASNKRSLLKQLVKKSSKKRNLLKLLVKQATGTEGINTNYLIGGGIGLLGGLGLYHFLNNEEAKKKGLGGYIGAGLTGLGAGLLGAGAYNQTQYGALTDQYPGYKRIPFNPEKPITVDGGKAPLVVDDGGKKYMLQDKETGNYQVDTTSSSSSGDTSTPEESAGGSGWTPGGIAGVAGTAALGAGSIYGTGQAFREHSNQKSTDLKRVLNADSRARAREGRGTVFENGFKNVPNPIRPVVRVATKVPRMFSNLAESLTSAALGNKALNPTTRELYEKLLPMTENFNSGDALSILEDRFANVGGRPENILRVNREQPRELNLSTYDTPELQKFISANEVPFGPNEAFKQRVAKAYNQIQFWKAVHSTRPDDPVIKNYVDLAEANYKNLLDGKVKYGDIGRGATLRLDASGNPITYANSPISGWTYYADADPNTLHDLADRWNRRATDPAINTHELLRDMAGQRQYLPGDLQDIVSEDYARTFNEVPELTVAEAKNLPQAYGERRTAKLQELADAHAAFEQAVQTNSPNQGALRNEVVKLYNELEDINRRYADIKGEFLGAPLNGQAIRRPDRVRPAQYLDEKLIGFDTPEAQELQIKHDWAKRNEGNPKELNDYILERDRFIKNNLEARVATLMDAGASREDAYRALSKDTLADGTRVPKAIQEAANKQLWKSTPSRLWNRLSNLWRRPQVSPQTEGSNTPPTPPGDGNSSLTPEEEALRQQVNSATEDYLNNQQNQNIPNPAEGATPNVVDLTITEGGAKKVSASKLLRTLDSLIQDNPGISEADALTYLKEQIVANGFKEQSADRIIRLIQTREDFRSLLRPLSTTDNPVAPTEGAGQPTGTLEQNSTSNTSVNTTESFKDLSYEDLQTRVDTLERAVQNLENRKGKAGLNEKGETALEEMKAQLQEARKELRGRPEFKSTLQKSPFGHFGTGQPRQPNKGETSSLNRFESRPEFWANLFGNKSEGAAGGSSNSGSNQAQIFADMISGRTIGIPTGNTFTVDTDTPIFPDLFPAEDTDVPPSEIPEVPQGNTGTPKAQTPKESIEELDPFEEFDKQVEDERNKVRTRTSEEWKQLAEKQLNKNYLDARDIEFKAIDKDVREDNLDKDKAQKLKNKFHQDIARGISIRDAFKNLQEGHVNAKRLYIIKRTARKKLERG